jgi:hypothetical protein
VHDWEIPRESNQPRWTTYRQGVAIATIAPNRSMNFCPFW